jgi:hypothetical protein
MQEAKGNERLAARMAWKQVLERQINRPQSEGIMSGLLPENFARAFGEPQDEGNQQRGLLPETPRIGSGPYDAAPELCPGLRWPPGADTIAQNVHLARDVDPTKAREAARAWRKLGMPEGVAYRNLADAKNEFERRAISDALLFLPRDGNGPG